MQKVMLIAGALALIALAAPAFAEDECTPGHMKKMDQMIAKMSDAAKQKEAKMHLDMSKAAMEKGDKSGCMQHMQEAHKAMGLS
jgi:hypothetical protein